MISRDIDNLLEKRLNGKQLSENEAVSLIMASTLDDVSEKIIKAASELERPHKDKVFILPPLYVTGTCENKCVYCNFKENGNSLSLDEFKDEFQALLDKGYRSIELVFGQDPYLFTKKNFDLREQKYNINRVLEYFRTAKQMLNNGMLTINAPPLDKESYKKLKETGLDVFLLWAETFNPMQYTRLHPGNTPKTEQRFRLESYERAKKSGIKHMAGTFLKGLYNWRVEESLLCYLDRRLEEKFNRGFSIIGTPRYKGKELNPIKNYNMSDKDYILNIALNLLTYNGVNWLQTREPWHLNEKIIDTFGGGFILTLDCSTAPGGYAEKSKGKSQFPVHPYKPEIITPKLDEKGIQVVYDWNVRQLEELQKTYNNK